MDYKAHAYHIDIVIQFEGRKQGHPILYVGTLYLIMMVKVTTNVFQLLE